MCTLHTHTHKHTHTYSNRLNAYRTHECDLTESKNTSSCMRQRIDWRQRCTHTKNSFRWMGQFCVLNMKWDQNIVFIWNFFHKILIYFNFHTISVCVQIDRYLLFSLPLSYWSDDVRAATELTIRREHQVEYIFKKIDISFQTASVSEKIRDIIQ